MMKNRLLNFLFMSSCIMTITNIFLFARAEDDDDMDDDLDAPNPNEAMVLTDSNFHETLKSSKPIFVKFYAPWCGHCQRLEPHFEEAARVFAQLQRDSPTQSTKVVFAKVDGTEEGKVASAFEVAGFPTIKWIVDGRVTEYDGGRDATSIVKWIQTAVSTTFTVLSNRSSAEHFFATSLESQVPYLDG